MYRNSGIFKMLNRPAYLITGLTLAATLLLAGCNLPNRSAATPTSEAAEGTAIAQTLDAIFARTGTPAITQPLATAIVTQTVSPGGTSGTAQACSGAPPSRLQVGGRAVVDTTRDIPNNVRTEASLDGDVVGLAQPGEEVQILNSPPVCAAGFLWWRVRTAGGVEGWTAEGEGSEYWLRPLD